MNTIAFVYYSRKGHTEELVYSISSDIRNRGINVAIHRVKPVQEYGEPLHFNPRLFIDTVMGRRIAIEVEPGYDPQNYVLTIIATPIWFGRPTPPIREFVVRYSGKNINVICIASSALGRGYSTKFRKLLEDNGYRVHLCFDTRESLYSSKHVDAIVSIYEKLVERT